MAPPPRCHSLIPQPPKPSWPGLGATYQRQSSAPVLASSAIANERPPQSPPEAPSITMPVVVDGCRRELDAVGRIADLRLPDHVAGLWSRATTLPSFWPSKTLPSPSASTANGREQCRVVVRRVVVPERLAGGPVDRLDRVQAVRHVQDTLIRKRGALFGHCSRSGRQAERAGPRELQPADVGGRDLRQGRVAGVIQPTTHREPVGAGVLLQLPRRERRCRRDRVDFAPAVTITTSAISATGTSMRNKRKVPPSSSCCVNGTAPGVRNGEYYAAQRPLRATCVTSRVRCAGGRAPRAGSRRRHAAAREHRDGRDRQVRPDPTGAHGARLQGPCAARGRPRHGEDDSRARACRQHRGLRVVADPVHAGPAADRRDGADRLRPARAGVPLPAGPVFGNVLLVDEINRAMPKTQSALLEAMAEGQVTVDGVTHDLPAPFLLLATENPIEQEGTFPLPEAQLDRFFLRTALGYPDLEEELSIVEGQLAGHPLDALKPVDRQGRRLGAPGGDRGDLRRRAPAALDHRARAGDALARLRRARRVGARLAGARAGGSRPRADRRTRPRRARRRRAPVRARRAAPARAGARVPRRRRADGRRGRTQGLGGRARRAHRGRRRSGTARARRYSPTSIEPAPRASSRSIPRRRLSGTPFGERPSTRRGRGSDVAGTRPYVPGDPVSTIDWFASARLSSARGEDEFVVRQLYAEEAPRVIVVSDTRRVDVALRRRPALAVQARRGARRGGGDRPLRDRRARRARPRRGRRPDAPGSSHPAPSPRATSSTACGAPRTTRRRRASPGRSPTS